MINFFQKDQDAKPTISHQTINLTENKAPTDASVRLLYDMEKAARDKIIESVRLEDSIVDCVIHTYDDFVNFDKRYCAVFKINGKKFSANYSTNLDNKDKESVVMGIRDAIALEVANKIFLTSKERIL